MRFRSASLFAMVLTFAVPVPGQAHEEGVIRVVPETAALGGDLTIVGEKLPEEGRLRLELRGALETFPLAEVQTDAAGEFRIELTLPSEANPGAYSIVAVAPDGEDVGRVDLTITGAPSNGPVERINGPAAATDRMMDLPTSGSGLEWVLVLGLVGLSALCGIWLLRPGPDRPAP